MKEQPAREQHYNKNVWVNPTTESVRREECLCLNCDDLKSDQPEGCPVAKKLYKLCKGADIALTVTRCPFFAISESAKQAIVEAKKEHQKQLDASIADQLGCKPPVRDDLERSEERAEDPLQAEDPYWLNHHPFKKGGQYPGPKKTGL